MKLSHQAAGNHKAANCTTKQISLFLVLMTCCVSHFLYFLVLFKLFELEHWGNNFLFHLSTANRTEKK